MSILVHNRSFFIMSSVALLLSACVGTDIINDSQPVMPARIEIAPEAAAVAIDDVVEFSAVYYDSLGEMVAGTIFEWRSLSSQIASIDANGTARGVKAGQAMLIAEANGITSEPALLTVVSDPNQVALVEVAPASLQLSVDEKEQLTATARNLQGDVIASVKIDWRSLDESIAKVDSIGEVTAIGAGNTSVLAMASGIESSPVSVSVVGTSRTGTFQKRAGTSYDVSGTAILEQQESGQLLLRFADDFSSSNGPGLHVYLSNSNSVNGQSLDLGNLISTSGEQSYLTPQDIQLSLATYDWVIIHCVPFNVTFGFARLL